MFQTKTERLKESQLDQDNPDNSNNFIRTNKTKHQNKVE